MDTIAAAFTNHITFTEAIDGLTAIGTTTGCWSVPLLRVRM
jgi:hypothetical protein